MLRKVCTVLFVLFGVAAPALAAEGATAGGMDSFAALAAGLAIGIAAFGGAIGQGRTASSALESIGRNPGAADQTFTPMILGLVLIESLVIYALVIAMKLVGIF
ncbi:ATP synthase F0 subunit C [bacterium]|nr:ATP synthase F0 subunit C [bacterium]